MSYNIDSSEYITGRLFIKRSKLLELEHKHRNDLPEGCFLSDMAGENEGGDGNERLPIANVCLWYGEGSGHSFDLFKEVLSHTTGKADILLIWEGGDSRSCLHVDNGKVKEHKVKMELGDEE